MSSETLVEDPPTTVGQETQPQDIRQLPVEYLPFALAQAIHNDPHRFRVIRCGRRYGKSTLGIQELRQMAEDVGGQGETDPRTLVVAPTFGKVEEDWRIATDAFRHVITGRNEAEKTLQLGPFGQMDFRSADSVGGAARGGGYNAALLDEAAYIPEEVWERDVRPSLSDRRGRAVFISTPFGRNWFYDLWKMVEEHPDDYARWHYTTLQGWESRYADQPLMLEAMHKEWAQIRESTSERTFRQEYLAEFLEEEGQFFNLSLCLRGQLHPARSGQTYVAGLDVAHVEDWMAVVVIEVESRQVVGVSRFRHRSWNLQKSYVRGFLSLYPHVRVFIDAIGMGDPIFQDLSHDLDTEAVVLGSRAAKKEQVVENLAVALDHGYVGIPNQPETHWLLDELRDFQESKTKSGHVQYGAPSGKHDDGVSALMLACWPLRWSWHHPIFPERPSLVAEGTGMTIQQWDRLTEQSRVWRQAYPNIAVPWHPQARMKLRLSALRRFR